MLRYTHVSHPVSIVFNHSFNHGEPNQIHELKIVGRLGFFSLKFF